jgi:hypothetical protein
MTDREKIIEAMAKAIAGAQGYSADNWRGFFYTARAALSAIEGMGCVVVPREIDDGTAEAIWAGAYGEWAEFGASDKDGGRAAHRAAIAASPFAKETSDG